MFKNKLIFFICGFVNNFYKFIFDDEVEDDVKNKESEVGNKDIVVYEIDGKEKMELNKKDGINNDKWRVLKFLFI